MIEPIKVWELEAGNPKYQVPRFQRIAATSSESGVAANLQNQFDWQQGDDSESHDSCRGDDAQEIEEAAPHHRNVRVKSMRVDDGSHGVGGIVEAVYNARPNRKYGSTEGTCRLTRSRDRLQPI